MNERSGQPPDWLTEFENERSRQSEKPRDASSEDGRTERLIRVTSTIAPVVRSAELRRRRVRRLSGGRAIVRGLWKIVVAAALVSLGALWNRTVQIADRAALLSTAPTVPPIERLMPTPVPPALPLIHPVDHTPRFFASAK